MFQAGLCPALLSEAAGKHLCRHGAAAKVLHRALEDRDAANHKAGKGAGKRFRPGWCLTLLSLENVFAAGFILTKGLQRAEGGPSEAAVPEKYFFSDATPLLLLGSADII